MVWQWLIRSWIQQAASQKLHEVAHEALREHQEGHQQEMASAESSEPPECDVGIVYALNIPLGGLEDRLQGKRKFKGSGFLVRYGTIDGRRVALLESGPGREAAAHGTAALIAGHQPKWIVSAGFGGGLVEPLKKRHFLLAQEIMDLQGGRISVDFKISPSALQATPYVHLGRLLTVDSIVRTSADKRRLAEAHEAQAVDMETYAVADVCRQAGVKFMSVRIISDAVTEELPPEVENLFQQKTMAGKVGAAVGAIFHRPSSLKDLWQLKEDAIVASEKLATFLQGVIGQLAPAAEAPSQSSNES